MKDKIGSNFSVRFRMRRRLLLLVVLLVALYVLVPQIGGLSSSLTALRGARPGYALAGLAAMGATYVVAAGTYWFLAKHGLQFSRTTLVQLSGAFVNRLLPAGIGGMGLNAQYLRTVGHSVPEAIAVVGANNVMGFLGNTAVVWLLLAFNHMSFQLKLPHVVGGWYIALGIGGVVAANLFFFPHLRRAIVHMASGVGQALGGYSRHPWRLVGALGTSMALTVLHVIALWCASQAIGVSLPLAAYAVIFSAGTLAAAATPTPGGLVGMEAGLAAGFVAYGVDAGQGLAIALLYRLVTYWLPLIPGFMAFTFVRRQLKLFY